MNVTMRITSLAVIMFVAFATLFAQFAQISEPTGKMRQFDEYTTFGQQHPRQNGDSALTITVMNAITERPIAGASVEIYDDVYNQLVGETDGLGVATFTVSQTSARAHSIYVCATGYYSKYTEFFVSSETTEMSIYMTPANVHRLSGTVSPISFGANADVAAFGQDTCTRIPDAGASYVTKCDALGNYEFVIPEGEYELRATNYHNEARAHVIVDGSKVQNITLSSCAMHNFTVRGFLKDALDNPLSAYSLMSLNYWDDNGSKLEVDYAPVESNSTTGEYVKTVALPSLSGKVQIVAGGFSGYLQSSAVINITSSEIWQNFTLQAAPENTATLHLTIQNSDESTFAILFDLARPYLIYSPSYVNATGKLDLSLFGGEFALIVMDGYGTNRNISKVSIGDFEDRSLTVKLNPSTKVESYHTYLEFSDWQNLTIKKSIKLTREESYVERLILECYGGMWREFLIPQGVLVRDGIISPSEAREYRNVTEYGTMRDAYALPYISVEGVPYVLSDAYRNQHAWNWSASNFEGPIFSDFQIYVNCSYVLRAVSTVAANFSGYVRNVLFGPHIDGFGGVSDFSWDVVLPPGEEAHCIVERPAIMDSEANVSLNGPICSIDTKPGEIAQTTFLISSTTDRNPPSIVNHTNSTTANNGALMRLYLNATDGESGLGRAFVEYSGDIAGVIGREEMTYLGEGTYAATIGPVSEGFVEYRFIVYDNSCNSNASSLTNATVVPYVDTAHPEVLDFTTIAMLGDSESVTIFANITDDCGVANAQLHLYFGGIDHMLQMTKGAGELWSVRISKLPITAGTVTYYITANDTSNNNATSSSKSFQMRDSTPPTISIVYYSPEVLYTHTMMNITCFVTDATSVSVNVTLVGNGVNATYAMNRSDTPGPSGAQNFSVVAYPIALSNHTLRICFEATDAYGNRQFENITANVMPASGVVKANIVGKAHPGETVTITGFLSSGGVRTGIGYALAIDLDGCTKTDAAVSPDGNFSCTFTIPLTLSQGVHEFNITVKDLIDGSSRKVGLGFSYRLPRAENKNALDLSVIITALLACILVGMLLAIRQRSRSDVPRVKSSNGNGEKVVERKKIE